MMAVIRCVDCGYTEEVYLDRKEDAKYLLDIAEEMGWKVIDGKLYCFQCKDD